MTSQLQDKSRCLRTGLVTLRDLSRQKGWTNRNVIKLNKDLHPGRKNSFQQTGWGYDGWGAAMWKVWLTVNQK